MFLLIASFVACGPPDAPPVGVGAPFLRDAAAPHTIDVGFGLDDAAGERTIAAGTVLLEITDRLDSAPKGSGMPVCSGTADVPVSRFTSETLWTAHVDVLLEPWCPELKAGITREGLLTFTPAGGSALPAETVYLTSSQTPSISTPQPAPPAPPPEEVVRVAPWPLALALPGAVVSADPKPTPVNPDGKIVTAGSCSASLFRAPGIAIDGGTIRLNLATDGAKLSVDEVAPDRWALHYDVGGKFGVNQGVVVGEWAYICRGDYATADQRACAARICASVRAG